MAHLDPSTIHRLTQLSRIDCTEQEQEALLIDLKKILAYVEQLQTVDTEGVPPCIHVIDDLTNVMRSDTIQEVLPRQLFLANAPSRAGLILIPPVL